MEFHINNIYPKLMTHFKNLDMVNFSRISGNNHYLLGEYVNVNDKKEIERFSNFDFANKDFYSSLAEDILKQETDIEEINDEVIKLNRNSVKKSIMNILFNQNEIHREADRVNIGFGANYLQVDKFITLFHRLYTSRDFALLLQRCEAFIVLEKATFNIIKKHPTVPIFTIHDCIITTMDNIKLVESEMVQEIEKVTKKQVGVKSEQISFHNKSPIEDQIDGILIKHKITSKESLKKKLINIKESNIDFALEYLYNNSPNKKAEWQSRLTRSIQL
jgi:translation elongation factor EF-1beta